jgi:hypothetical protein
VSQETTYTADDVAAAFRAGLELGRRADLAITPERLVTEDQARTFLDGGPAPTGLDPETIAAARRIARCLNGRPR